MKTRLLAITLATLAGCGSSKPATTTTTPPAPEVSTVEPAAPPAPPPAPAKPKAEIGAWGFDAAGMDKSVAPGESFFRYANGTWVKNTEIPADRSRIGERPLVSGAQLFDGAIDLLAERPNELLNSDVCA